LKLALFPIFLAIENNLVAIELKITDFRPEYIGKMQFYLEALDQDVKKTS